MAAKLSAAAASRVRGNFERIQAQVSSLSGGRPVRIVCVTKYAPLAWIEALLQAGATELGENLLPQAVERFEALRSAGFMFERHLIGAQQSRKLKLIPGHFELFQALDRRESMHALQRHSATAGVLQNVLLQVNIGEEPQKHGFAPSEAAAAAREINSECPNLALRGLMAIPPGPYAYTSDSEFERGSRGHFDRMSSLFAKIGSVESRSAGWDTLSMGMSQDYLWAVEAGATMVRIGSALFEGMEG